LESQIKKIKEFYSFKSDTHRQSECIEDTIDMNSQSDLSDTIVYEDP